MPRRKKAQNKAEERKKHYDSHGKKKVEDFVPQTNVEECKKRRDNQSDQEKEIAQEKKKKQERVRYKEDDHKQKKLDDYQKNKEKINENLRKKREETKNKPQHKVDQNLAEDMDIIDQAERMKNTDPQGYEDWWSNVHAKALENHLSFEANDNDPRRDDPN